MSITVENSIPSASARWLQPWLWLAERLENDQGIRRATLVANFLALAFTSALIISTWYLFLHSRGYIDYVEGLVLFHQTQAAAGENIYDAKFRSAPLYSLPMYGPVFYYLVAPAVAGHPSLLPGRIVSIASLLAISLLSWRLLRRRFGAGPLVAAVAAVPWLALLGPLYFGANNRVDPLSVFFGIAALFAAYSSRPKAWFVCIPLLLLAGFTRATAAVAPGAAIFLMFVSERRFKDAILLASSVVLVAATILIAGDYLSGGNFTKCLIFTNGAVPLKQIYWTTMTQAVCKQALLPVGVVLSLLLFRDRSTRLFGIHALLSSLLAVITSGKIGSHVNYFIEPSWAACMSLALVLATIRKPLLFRVATIATCVLLFQSAARDVKRIKEFYGEMNRFPNLMSLVERYGAKGPILTMESGAQVFAGQKIYMADLHIFTRLNEIGKFDFAPVFNDVRQQRLAAIISRGDVQPGFVGHTNWTPEMRRVVAMYYRPIEQYADYLVLVPRETPLAEDALNPAGFRHRLTRTEFYPNGRKANEVELVDEKKDGVEREWDEQGHLLRETAWLENVQTGAETRWYENGTMASRAEFVEGKLSGTVVTWRPNGQEWTEANYADGALKGRIVCFDDRGASPRDAKVRLASAGAARNR